MKEIRIDDTDLILFISDKILFSKALWQVFSEVVKGNNYVSRIAKKLKKNKSIVSKQLKALENVGVLIPKGEGVKLYYEINWENLIKIWVLSLSHFLYFEPDLAIFLKKGKNNLPKELVNIRLTAEEVKEIERENSDEKLFRKISRISGILGRYIKAFLEFNVTHYQTFYEAFEEFAKCLLAIILEIISVKVKPETEGMNEFFKVVSSPIVTGWLKLISFVPNYGAYIVRQMIIRDFASE